MYKIWKHFEKGLVIIARNKLLEKALGIYVFFAFYALIY